MKPSSRTATHQVLVAARQRLLTRGWTQGRYGCEYGPNCLTGAVIWEGPLPANGYRLLEKLMKENINLLRWNVLRWNDEPGRTVEDVINLLDQAIEQTKE